jgi:hypothetical protein
MSVWTFFDYAELSGRNQISEWLSGLPVGVRAKIDNRLLHMIASPRWPEKRISRYHSTGKLYEFRISGNKVEYRPLGFYYGPHRYIILAGAIEKGDKIPKSDVDTANERHDRARKNSKHAVAHQFEDEGDLEENEG